MTHTRIVVAAAGLALAAAPAAHAGQHCKVAHSKTLASSAKVRVFAKSGVARACYKPTNQRFVLPHTKPARDVFTAAGKFVGYSSSDGGNVNSSVVNVVRASDHKIPQFLPNDTNGHVDAIVVKKNGAAAWAYSMDEFTTVQGTDRKGHSPDQLSDDTKTVDTASLASGPGGEVHWDYTDGTSGSADLFTEPADLF